MHFNQKLPGLWPIDVCLSIAGSCRLLNTKGEIKCCEHSTNHKCSARHKMETNHLITFHFRLRMTYKDILAPLALGGGIIIGRNHCYTYCRTTGSAEGRTTQMWAVSLTQVNYGVFTNWLKSVLVNASPLLKINK